MLNMVNIIKTTEKMMISSENVYMAKIKVFNANIWPDFHVEDLIAKTRDVAKIIEQDFTDLRTSDERKIQIWNALTTLIIIYNDAERYPLEDGHLKQFLTSAIYKYTRIRELLNDKIYGPLQNNKHRTNVYINHAFEMNTARAYYESAQVLISASVDRITLCDEP